jgi:hypothetical protein
MTDYTLVNQFDQFLADAQKQVAQRIGERLWFFGYHRWQSGDTMLPAINAVIKDDLRLIDRIDEWIHERHY